MKKGLLALTVLLIGLDASAQNLAPDFNNEIGIYSGIAPFTTPTMVHEKGTDNVLPAVFCADYHYNINDSWQAGINATASRWESKGTVSLDSLYNKKLGNATTDYLYADRAFTITFRLNRVMPHYDQNRANRSNFYYGIAGGVAFTANDGNNGYGQFSNAAGEQFRYVSAYHYESGAGYILGAQVGWNYYFSEHFGFNAEFAPRFTHMGMIDNRDQSRNAQYDIFTFPVLVGLRCRF